MLSIQLDQACDDNDDDECMSPIVVVLAQVFPTDCMTQSTGSISVDLGEPNADFVFAWSNGSSESGIDNLAPGVYEVTVTRRSNEMCTLISSYTIEEVGSIQIQIASNSPSGCEDNNGEVTLLPENIMYTWSDGGIGNERTDLPSGMYNVIGQDSMGCSSEISVEVVLDCDSSTTDCASPPVVSDVLISDTNCGEATGSISLILTEPLNEFTYLWSSGQVSSDISNLSAGVYNLTITRLSDTNCILTTSFVVNDIDATDIVVTTNVPSNCDDNNGIIALAPSSLLFTWSDGELGSLRTDLASGEYFVSATNTEGCISVITVIVSQNCDDETMSLNTCDTPPVITDALVLPSNCGDNDGGISIELLGEEDDFDIEWSNGLSGLAIDRLSAGLYEVMITSKLDTLCVLNTTFALSDSASTDVQISNVNPAGCEDDNGAVTLVPANLSYTWSDGGVGNTRSDLPAGTYEVRAENENGCTTVIEVNVEQDCEDIPASDCFDLFDSQEMEFVVDCPDSARLCVQINLEDLNQYEILNNGLPYDGPIDACGANSQLGYYSYSSLPGEGNDGPYSVESWTIGNVTFSGVVENISALIDSMNVWDSATLWELDENNLSIISSDNSIVDYNEISVLHIASGELVDLDILQNISENNISLYFSQGVHELVITMDSLNCSDTLLIDVICNGSTPNDTSFVNLVVDSTGTLCFDDLGLSIIDYCIDQDGQSTISEIRPDLSCIDILGVSSGVDTTCIILCDSNAVCDTNYIIVNVLPLTPFASTDDTLTIVDNPVEIDVLANDSLYSGTLLDIALSLIPSYGVVEIDTINNTIVYNPDIGICGVLDSFKYTIRTEGGVDEATVFVNILCEEITVFNGLSPNGDGINDEFTILGIELFPDNSLTIFNRYGNSVFHKNGYRNDVDPFVGKWNGKNLPDGTYFYLLELSKGKVHSGYISIYR